MMKVTTVMGGMGLQPPGSRVPQEQQEGVYQPLASTTNVHIYVAPAQGPSQHTHHSLDPGSSHVDAEILPPVVVGTPVRPGRPVKPQEQAPYSNSLFLFVGHIK